MDSIKKYCIGFIIGCIFTYFLPSLTGRTPNKPDWVTSGYSEVTNSEQESARLHQQSEQNYNNIKQSVGKIANYNQSVSATNSEEQRILSEMYRRCEQAIRIRAQEVESK